MLGAYCLNGWKPNDGGSRLVFAKDIAETGQGNGVADRSPIHEHLRGDPLWRTTAYRKAVAISELVWEDLTVLEPHGLLRGAVTQLLRAVGSIRANIAEGYGRRSGADRARYLEYALGSAREAREWYHYLRRPLEDGVAERRLALLSQIIRLLLVTIPRERPRSNITRAAREREEPACPPRATQSRDQATRTKQ